MPFTNYLDQKLVQLLFGNDSYTVPTTLYFALYSAAPTQSTSGTELASTGSYARASLGNAAANSNWTSTGAANGYGVSNAVAISFPTATANWSSAVAVGVLDASSGGNLLAYATFTGVAVQSGATASFAIGALTFTDD